MTGDEWTGYICFVCIWDKVLEPWEIRWVSSMGIPRWQIIVANGLMVLATAAIALRNWKRVSLEASCTSRLTRSVSVRRG